MVVFPAATLHPSLPPLVSVHPKFPGKDFILVAPTNSPSLVERTMDQSLPDAITLEYALNPRIRISYTKFRKITFLTPDELKGRTANSLFEASFIVRNAPSFPTRTGTWWMCRSHGAPGPMSGVRRPF